MIGDVELGLMEDKSFYTLIRRFRYQYKKYHAIKDLNREYCDKHIRESLEQVEVDLKDTTHKIILMVLGGFINPNNTSLEFHQDVPIFNSSGGRIGAYARGNQNFEVIVDNKDYYDYVAELMGYYYEM